MADLVELSPGRIARRDGLDALLVASVSCSTELRAAILHKIEEDYDEPTMRQAELYLDQNQIKVKSSATPRLAYTLVESKLKCGSPSDSLTNFLTIQLQTI
jgi:hypothetical protein